MAQARQLEGIRVLEVASWMMAPTTGGVLAEWGADVVKVEHPLTGDPLRGLTFSAVMGGDNPVNVAFHHANRNKRSVALDITTEAGLNILYRLATESDVFLTNFLPALRTRLKIDVEDVRAHSPQIIYARGSAVGPRGPERNRGGYDFASFWCRAGIAEALHVPGLDYPPQQPGGQGDTTTAVILAGAIATALFHRERFGEPSVVDASLLATGAWMMGVQVAAAACQEEFLSQTLADRRDPPNPLVNLFKTKDERFLAFCMLQADREWPEFCERLDHKELVGDPRFEDATARKTNAPELTDLLDEVFASRTLSQWQDRLHGTRAVWELAQTMPEVASDPQVLANDYLVRVDGVEGVADAASHLVSAPAQFDEQSPRPRPAPEHGQHTEEILLGLDYTWEEIIDLKDRGVIP